MHLGLQILRNQYFQKLQRKNKKSTKCKQYVFDVNTAKSFLSCASKKIGKKYIKEYIVNPIDREIPGAKEFIMAAYNLI